ncbi:MAG: hypothetical protein CR968_06180, partial [Flavobacteriia bacterium]
MKKLISSALFAITFGLFISSCSSEDVKEPTCSDGIQNQGETAIDCGGPCGDCAHIVTGKITENTTWTNDQIWVIEKHVVVTDGVTLTIEPGTIIKGKEGQGTLASALIIEKGAKIMAEGTADAPIIFTSINDNIALDQTSGTNLSIADTGLWGGLIILGKATGSFEGNVTEFNIEGIAASDEYGSYGGTDDTDNSGSLKYVSIRHGGTDLGEGDEING